MRAERASFVQASSEAWARRNISEAMGWARGAARCRFSSNKRDGRRSGATPISRQEWLGVWQLPGGEGGMKVIPIDLEQWRNQRDDLDLAQINDMARYDPRFRELALEDIKRLRKYVRKASKRRVVPDGTAPLEL
eukprot:3677772-Pyramimonas_sp.AAC.1